MTARVPTIFMLNFTVAELSSRRKVNEEINEFADTVIEVLASLASL